MFQILIVDDNPADVTLAEMAIRAAGLEASLITLPNGQAALDYLDRKDPPPDLVILDLNLPRANGFEVIQAFSESPRCAATPIIITSGTLDQAELARAARFPRVRLFSKPGSLNGYMELGQLAADALASRSGQ